MKGKKRLIGIIAGLTMSALSITGLAACGDGHEHSWKSGWSTSATEHWHDPECDDTTELKDKAGHTWDNGVVVEEATHTKAGKKKYTCTVCDYEKTETISATGHTYAESLDYDDNFHWKAATCDCDGMTEAELKKDKAEHTLKSVVDTPYTETANGKHHYECSTEGCNYATERETLYNYIGEKISGGDKVSVGHVEDDTTTIRGAVADYTAGNWSGSVKLNIGELADKNIAFSFTVKNTTNSQAQGNEEWASQRFAVQGAKGNRGFLFFEPKGECNIFDMTDVGIRDEGKTKLNRLDWIGTQLRTESGASFRIVRAGNKLVFSAKNTDNAWVEIGSIDCGDAENEIILYACGVTYEFSGFETTALTHVDEKAPNESETGNYEYYYTGEDENKVYYDANGKLTTWDKIERPAVIASVEITLQTKKDGATAAFNGTAIKVNGEDVGVTGGKITLTNVEPNVEITFATDDYTGKATPVAGTASYTVTLEYKYATGSGLVDLSQMNEVSHKITVTERDKSGDSWTGSATLNELNKTTASTFVYDLHIGGKYSGSWGDASAWQRIGIQVTENTGFYLWVRNNLVTIRKFVANNKTNASHECGEEMLVGGAQEGAFGWISNAVLSTDGADVRIVRIGTKLVLHVKNGDNYVAIGSVTCGEEANAFAVYGVTAEFAFSDFAISSLTHITAKDPSTTEAGNHEYYYTGADANKVYYGADGKLTTWDKIERPKFDMWDSATLTLSGGDIAEGTQIVLTYDILTITTTVGADGVITLAGDNAISKNVYMAVVGGYRFDVDFTASKEVTKTLVTAADFTANKGDNGFETIEMGDAADSTEYDVTFTLKTTTGQDTWKYRFAVLLIDGDASSVTGIGSITKHDGKLMVWSAKGVNPNDEGDGINKQEKNDEKSLKFDELVKGANGANIKVSRNGTNATMYFELDGEWVELYSTTLAEGNTALKFACNNGIAWNVSNIMIDYVA